MGTASHIRTGKQKAAQDIELVVPIQANGAQAIIDWLPGMQALGMTPMSESIKQAANDFTFEPGRKNFIVLISDGAETCGDEPATVVQYLKEIGVDFAIHVIGLDVDAQTAAQLKAISDLPGVSTMMPKAKKTWMPLLNNINQKMLPPAGSPTALAVASATPIPEPNAEIASEGTVEASSIYDATFPASLAVDGDLSTSWFSAGAIKGDSNPTYVWTGLQDDFIASIELISNREHQVVDFPHRLWVWRGNGSGAGCARQCSLRRERQPGRDSRPGYSRALPMWLDARSGLSLLAERPLIAAALGS